MADLFASLDNRVSEPAQVIAGRRIKGSVAGIYAALQQHFETVAVDHLNFSFDGIDGDYHAGVTRKSGGREPWYPRGTLMRNERQVSIVARDELELIAREMGLAELRPEWIGANLVLDDIPSLSMLPPRTLLFFAGGVTLKVDGQNAPCKIAGSAIARNLSNADVDATAIALDFVRVAKRLRGLVAWVEKPGIISNGETLTAKTPEQWIYQG